MKILTNFMKLVPGRLTTPHNNNPLHDHNPIETIFIPFNRIKQSIERSNK